MQLTTRGRYAVTAMLDLALNQHSRPVALRDIAASQELSPSYLERLFADLRRSRLVRSTRGPGGGYTLARRPAEISVADIIASVDEGIDITRCGGREDCRHGERCLTHELWSDLSDKIREFLDGVSLDELIERERRRGGAAPRSTAHARLVRFDAKGAGTARST